MKNTMQLGKYKFVYFGSLMSDVNQARFAYAYSRYIELPQANKTRLGVFRAAALRRLRTNATALFELIDNKRSEK